MEILIYSGEDPSCVRQVMQWVGFAFAVKVADYMHFLLYVLAPNFSSVQVKEECGSPLSH